MKAYSGSIYEKASSEKVGTSAGESSQKGDGNHDGASLTAAQPGLSLTVISPLPFHYWQSQQFSFSFWTKVYNRQPIPKHQVEGRFLLSFFSRLFRSVILGQAP
jgi:hypothetical protein